MKYFATLGAVCAIGLSALASQAQADIYHFTQTGTINSGVDTQGLFGGAGADLSGRQYSAKLTFDPTLLTFVSSDDPVFALRNYYGSIGIAEIEVEGVSYSFEVGGLNQFTFLLGKADPAITPGWIYVANGTLTGSGGTVNLGLFSATNFMGPLELSTFDYALTDADRAFLGPDGAYWDGGDFKFALRADTISLTSEPGTLAPPAGVPEPASWALMIVGFGGAGVMLRSRRRPAFMG